MFQTIIRKAKQISNRGEPQLPGSYHDSRNNFWSPGKSMDGSAKSIHTAPTLQEAWRRSSIPVRITWIAILTCIFMFWYGIRWLRYNAAGISLDCNSITCQLTVRPVGWGRKVTLNEVPRHQLLHSKAVKTDKQGYFVTDQNIILHDPFVARDKKNKYKNKSSSNYKGPDENGYYLSYALFLTNHPIESHVEEGAAPISPVDLSPLKQYADVITAEDGSEQYRLIPKRFGIRQSRRRVRTMLQKVESYTKRRRQKLLLKESTPPAWQGVLLLVFGFIGFLLTLMLGQFQEERVTRGPGIRRQQQHHLKHSVSDPYKSQTPARYEVSTTPSLSSQTSGFRRNTTTARKRGT